MTHSSSYFLFVVYNRISILWKGKIMFTSKKALLLLANGSEESEVVITVDVNI